ncbi:hypothetical protein [Hyperthermus butylicus]|uniref:hypothetical protein n=1 Tax=Hyperthermus butylicus TaxID=54248 RepID=UPI00064F3F9E|nr:hypothetical protein [Hyperthermus butylicus]
MDVFVLGGYSRGIGARKVLREFERGGVGWGEAEAVIGLEEAMLVGVQAGAGLTYVSDPALAWHDLLRPFVEAWRGVAVGGLARFFDNNFFYRVPVFTGKPDPKYYVLAKRAVFLSKIAPRGAGVKVFMPGPVTFAALSDTSVFGGMEEAAREIARILGEEARRALEAGASVVEVAEPLLGDIDARPEHAGLLVDLLSKYFPDPSKLIVSIYYHPPSKEVAKELAVLKAQYLALDYADRPETFREAVKIACPEGLAVGAVDARSIYLEPVERVEKALQTAKELCSPDRLALTTTAPLDLIPQQHAIAKTRHLGHLARRLEEGA